MDRIKEMLDQLSELDDDSVNKLQDEIVSEFETVEKQDPTPQSVDAMVSLADMLDSVKAEVRRREAAAQELAQRAAEAATRVYGEGEEKEEMAEPMEEEKMEEAPAEETPAEEAPAAPAPEEMKKEEKAMTEASTDTEKAAELSTEIETTPEAVVETPAEETVVAAAEEVVEAAVVETPAVEATPAAEFEAQAETTDAVVEEAAEASTQEETTDAPVEAQENMEAPVTAAANADDLTPEVPADRRPVAQVSAAPVAITAGADIPGYTAGSTLNNMTEVAEAMAKRLHGLRRVNGGDGEQHIVASLTTSFPEERTLTQDAEENWSKIQAVTSPEALVASGGHSAPYQVRYEIFGMGTTQRPVRDALPTFQADRGGIRFITPPVLSDYANAVGVWTNVVDTDPGTDTKASLTVTAATENTVATDAVTLQLQFGNLMTRAYPELIARHNELGLIQHAREAEQNILTQIGSSSTAVTSTSLIGFGRDYLVQLGRAASAYRSRHRLPADFPLRVIAPSWAKDAMAADLTISAPGDSTLNAYGEIDAYLAARNVNITYTLDGNVAGAQSSGAMNEFSDTFIWYIFAEGTFLFLDGGTLDLGIIRDSTLVGTNDYKMFVETFEGVAKVGIESLKVTSTISINGVAAALRDTTGGASAAAIEY